ncbi:MAG: tetratricopeptide repeat protein [Myxococcota bacterium]
MSDFHLESYVERARDGTLSEEEQEKLRAHRAECVICWVEQEIEAEGTSQPEDDELFDRVFASMSRELPERRRASPWRYARSGAAVVAVLAVGGAAAAAIPAVQEALFSTTTVEPPEPAPVAPELTVPPAPRTPPEDPVEPEPPESVEEVAPPRPRPTLSEEALFREAGEARRRGNDARAIALYRQLQRRYPRSARARTSRVSLGRLFLRSGRAQAALQQFDGYLAASPSGSLAETALVGKARANAQLGRHAASRGAWQELLARFPDSLQADRAREVLER